MLAMAEWGYFVNALAAAPEGDGTLLIGAWSTAHSDCLVAKSIPSTRSDVYGRPPGRQDQNRSARRWASLTREPAWIHDPTPDRAADQLLGQRLYGSVARDQRDRCLADGVPAMRSFFDCIACDSGLAAAPMAAADPAAPASVELSDDGLIWVTPQGMTPLHVGKRRHETRRLKLHGSGLSLSFPIRRRASAATKSRAYQFAQSCVQNYPPLLAGADATPFGDWTIINRPEGTRQWAYRAGHSTRQQRIRELENVTASPSIRAPHRAEAGGSLAVLDFPAGLGLTRIGDDLGADGCADASVAHATPCFSPGDCAFCADVQPLGGVCDRPAAARLVGDRGGQWAGAIRVQAPTALSRSRRAEQSRHTR